jgi:hypothetical protein
MKKKPILYRVALSITCPQCGHINYIETYTASRTYGVSDKSHSYECNNCYAEFFWCIKCSDVLDDMPEKVNIIRSY